jgi:hypothetical protein
MPSTSFVPNSPDLLLDVFTKEILDSSKVFISELLISLKQSTNHHTKYLPA